MIQLEKITKTYGKGEATAHVLQGIDLKIESGEFLAIMGSSGSGKSTLLNIIGALDVPTEGKYLFQDVDISKLSNDQRALFRRNILGFVFQGFNLSKRTSALENVELPLIYQRVASSERKTRSFEALKSVGLENYLHHDASQLSGGQQQRVAIARAIVTRPKVLIADEPTGNLDSARSHEIMKLISAYNKEGFTIIMVTHEEDIAAYASRTIFLHDGIIQRDLHAH
jgi:putative ABC transport system ATP-binding protein